MQAIYPDFKNKNKIKVCFKPNNILKNPLRDIEKILKRLKNELLKRKKLNLPKKKIKKLE